jgi:hypothetical protein
MLLSALAVTRTRARNPFTFAGEPPIGGPFAPPTVHLTRAGDHLMHVHRPDRPGEKEPTIGDTTTPTQPATKATVATLSLPPSNAYIGAPNTTIRHISAPTSELPTTPADMSPRTA